MRWLTGAALTIGLAACQDAEPAYVLLTYGSYAASPVVVKDVTMNGAPVAHGAIAATEADMTTPRTTDYHTLGYPPATDRTQVTLSATWVEVFTHKAWTATVTGPLSAFARGSATDTILVGPVFGPNGLMVLTSDPLPTSATDIPQVDIARVCGTRTAEADFDYTADPGQLPGLPEMLQFSFPPVTAPECPVQD
jgi:hypothetical protein